MPLTISIGTDITKTWAEYCSKHRDVPGELSHPHRDVATQTGVYAVKVLIANLLALIENAPTTI